MAAFDCKAYILNSTLSKCKDCRILNVDSHEYQMEAFMYTCVILLFYLLLTTIFMVKIISPRVEKADDEDQKRFVDTQVLKKFRDREKKNNREFEIESRKEVKKQMIKYLKNMRSNEGETKEKDDNANITISTGISSMIEENYRPRRFSEQNTQTETNLSDEFRPTSEYEANEDTKSEYSAEFFV